ncbi:helix-turn-helix domain-containing protein [Chryseobacterium sp. PTM-20240506]|uniref:helix-turn-helix domain-containing protein n=1 Tax=Chryseobacterium sp. PTM-20240506 TaxID=3400631 RepID=UPI003AB0DB09
MNKADNQNVNDDIIDLIREKVKKYGFSNYQIAKLSGLSDVGIAKILDGRSKNPSEKTISKIQNAIIKYEKDLKEPVTLNSLNEKLDFIIGLLRANNLEIELIFEILKNSSGSSEELKKLEQNVKNKQF